MEQLDRSVWSPEMWDAITRGQVEGLRRLFEVGAYSAKMTVEECDRLLENEEHFSPDTLVKLRELRRRASAGLQ